MYMKDNAFVQILTRHFWAIALALLVGGVMVAPQIYFARHAPGYAGIAMMGTDAEEHYIARIQQAYVGFPGMGNVFMPNKDEPYFMAGFGEWIVARMGMLLGMSAVAVSIFSKFFFPFVTTLLAYAFAYELFLSRRVALLSAAFAMLGDTLVSSPSSLLALLHGTSTITGFLSYARPINPEVSGLFLFGALFLLYTGFCKQQVPKWWGVVGIGLLVGSSAYLSPYVFSFLVVFCALSFFWFLYGREFRRAARIAYAGGVALLTLLPFIFNYLRLIHSPWYAETALRFGVTYSHQPTISLWLFLMLAAVFVFWPKKYRISRPFFLISIFSLLLLLNQQVVTGVSLQSGHYHWYVTKPLLGTMLGLYAWIVIVWVSAKRSWMHVPLIGLAIASLSYNAVLVQESSYRAAYPIALAAQSYAPALEYLAAQPAVQTVWADASLSLYIPIYTVDTAPNNSYAIYYLNPDSFYLDRLFLHYRLNGVTPDEMLSLLQKDRAIVSAQLYGLYYRDQAGGYSAIPDTVLMRLANQYRTFYVRPYSDIFHELALTEIVADSRNPESAAYASISGLRTVGTRSFFTFYAITP